MPPLKYPGQTPQFPRIVDDFAGGHGNPQSEDCLTLNIWTMSPASTKKSGVLMWIHGGSIQGSSLLFPTPSPNLVPGFIVGDTNTPFYQGQYLVDSRDIVFVSLKSGECLSGYTDTMKC